MRKFQVIELLICILITLLVGSFFCDMKYWYIIVLAAIVYYLISYEHLSVAVNDPTEENKNSSDMSNCRLWFWIIALGVGIFGMIFCFAMTNWKQFFLWMLLGILCFYKLSKFFDSKHGIENADNNSQTIYETDINIFSKKGLSVVIFCIACIIFMVIWMKYEL